MEFHDKKNNLIMVTNDGLNVIAYHNDIEIGRIEFDERDEGTILYYMNVEANYQRQGIARQMMNEAVNIHGNNFGKPSFSSSGGECHEYYTQEGAAFIHYCIKKGLLLDTEIQEYDS
ncbi:GNAT family N-acetyltransferase [Thalassotalea ponticola]|uniref:GNAT family N-acetyltransferase n=1 Tax=Thalassotalea ponticola TaxID=1523392 RepID=UPI0025B3892B|nr:GNAT family N-acetyltransferase [Thalassotalea ponticola]MDN3652320.1 GNAT family N-acetyltransferase [Thalassotalea ponticola]